MANETIETMQEKTHNVYSFVTDTARKTVYAGVGAVALVGDQTKNVWHAGQDFASNLIARGEEVTASGRTRVSETISPRQDQVQEQVAQVATRTNETFDKYSEAVLTRANIPTSNDINALDKKLNSLNRKLNKAIKEQEKAAS